MKEEAKSSFFPESTFGCNPTEYREKKAKVEKVFGDLIQQNGGTRKANKFLKTVAEKEPEATGTELVEAVEMEVGLSAEERIINQTGMNPGEFIADQLLSVIAEPEITVSFNEKSGLSYQMKSQPGVKVKALEGLSKLTNANKGMAEMPKGVAALPLSDLLDMQAKLNNLTVGQEPPTTVQGKNEDKLIDGIKDTA